MVVTKVDGRRIDTIEVRRVATTEADVRPDDVHRNVAQADAGSHGTQGISRDAETTPRTMADR